jgi:Nickel responsive protein SCO4226-like
MQRFVIERQFPGAGTFTRAELQQIAQTSNAVIRDLGPGIRWEHSYVTSDKIFGVYLTESEDEPRERGRDAGRLPPGRGGTRLGPRCLRVV